jgi:hypothetical protein
MMSESGGNRPYFIPPTIDWDALPESHRVAITTIIEPVYDEYVVQATDALERSNGTSIASCLLMELLDQLDLGGMLAGGQDSEEAMKDRERLFSRLSRSMATKQKLTDGLMRLRNQKLKLASLDPFLARRVFGVRSGLTDAIESGPLGMETENADDSSQECDETEVG